MDKARQDAVLGLVFFAALALLLWGTLMLTNFSLRERPQMVVQFERLAGLAVGDGVYVLGKRVGEVIDTEYRPEQRPNRMRVVLQFDRDVSLRADAKVVIIDANLLGGKRVEIDPGIAEGLFPADSVPVGMVRANAIEALGEMMAGDDNKENLQGFLAGLNRVVSKIDTGQGTLGLLINERELFDSFRTAIDSARNSIQAIERGEERSADWSTTASSARTCSRSAPHCARSARRSTAAPACSPPCSTTSGCPRASAASSRTCARWCPTCAGAPAPWARCSATTSSPTRCGASSTT